MTEKRRSWRIALLSLLVLAIPLSVLLGVNSAITSASAPPSPSPTPATPSPGLKPYIVTLSPSNSIVAGNAPAATLADQARVYRHDQVAQILADLLKTGQASASTYDAASETFRVSLADGARSQLAAQRYVASINPASPTVTTDAMAPAQPPRVVARATSAANVSSVDYIQLYSPFMWGVTTFGGLSVQLTLLDSTGTITLGVPIQTYYPAPTNYIMIDPQYLYYETVFEDPNNPSHPAVMIVPGDEIHVVTSGTNPSNQQYQVDDKKIIVDNLTAYTSFQTGTVYGTAPPNSKIIVTVGTGNPSLSNYLTPGSQVTWAQVTSGADGSFSVSAFGPGPPTPNGPITMHPGTTGFVRLQHSNGDEVYTYHGQTLRVLENSPKLEAWFYGSATALNQNYLQQGVVVSRPDPQITFTLENSQGQTLASLGPKDVFIQPYDVTFNATILGGDIVVANVNGVESFTVPTTAITAVADTVHNQVTGSGPTNTSMVVGAGLIDGYLTQYSSFSYVTQTMTSSANGSFASGTINCGSSGHLTLQPGSFGWVGYEDSHGNFIYNDFAAPRNDVMVGFPYAEGWVANGLIQPTITVSDPTSGSSQVTAVPTYLYLDGEYLWFNLYYYTQLSQFLNPTDTVTIVSGLTTYTIVVDSLTGYPDVDANTVVGQAAPGTSLLVIPSFNRQSSVQVTANTSGNYTAANPYVSYDTGNCSTSSWTNTISKGSSGRTYLTHSDGSRVFVNWGRSMHVDENGNQVESFLYPTQDIDWFSTPYNYGITATVTLSPTSGPPVTVQCPYSGQLPLCPSSYAYSDDTVTEFTNSQGTAVPIQAGSSITVSFQEGLGTVWRPASISLTAIPYVLLSPNLANSTVGGLTAANWTTQSTLASPPAPSSNPGITSALPTTAVGPFQFLNSFTNQPITLVQGYSGLISSSDSFGHRVWSAWGATAYPVAISGSLQPGATSVCGTATPNNSVTIYDMTNNPTKVPIGSGPVNAQGNFCVTVGSPLVLNQVIIAQDSFGTDSEPVVVQILNQVFLPAVTR